MTRDELYNEVALHTEDQYKTDMIMTAVDAYSSASNNAKLPVIRSLPSEQELIGMLKDCRDLLVMCTLIDESGQSKALVDKVDSVMGWQ